jgi:hypothetical protein
LLGTRWQAESANQDDEKSRDFVHRALIYLISQPTGIAVG